MRQKMGLPGPLQSSTGITDGDLTQLLLDKMVAISHTVFSRAFSWMKSLAFWIFEFYWSLFLWVQLTISQHWLRQWLVACSTRSHYLQHMLPSSLTNIWHTKGRWVDTSTLLPQIQCMVWNRIYITQFMSQSIRKYLSFWQPLVQPLTKNPKWQHFYVRVCVQSLLQMLVLFFTSWATSWATRN